METAALMPSSPVAHQPDWIRTLPEDFYRQPQKLKIPFDPAMSATALVDLAVRSGLATWMAGISFPAGYTGASLAATLRGERCSHVGDDDDIFHQPRPLPEFTVTEAPRPREVEGGVFEKILWPSVYRAEDHRSHFNNDEVVAWYWHHGDRPRPTIVRVHGFLTPWWEVNEYYLGSRFLYELGCDVVLKTLPHHGPRSRNAKNVSGMDFVSRGIDALNHNVVQSTYDIRTLLDYLQRQGVERMGITGVSLGGYTSALLAGLDSRFEFAMPLMPMVSLPDAMMEWKPLNLIIQGAMRWYRVSMQDIRSTTAFHSPPVATCPAAAGAADDYCRHGGPPGQPPARGNPATALGELCPALVCRRPCHSPPAGADQLHQTSVPGTDRIPGLRPGLCVSNQ